MVKLEKPAFPSGETDFCLVLWTTVDSRGKNIQIPQAQRNGFDEW